MQEQTDDSIMLTPDHAGDAQYKYVKPVFFNRGSVEHKGSTNGIQWFRQI